MTKFYTRSIIALSLLTGFIANAQVGINTTEPHTSSVLDIVSTDKGLLIPRLSLSQRNNIPAPANGLLVYQTDDTPGFYYYNGSIWQLLSGSGAGNYVDLTTAQTINGTKTFSSDIIVRNIGLGRGAGDNNNENTAVGTSVLKGNTTGYYNTATGYNSLAMNTTGVINTANGTYSLAQNTTGVYNTANGGFAGYSNTTGSQNTASGTFALYQNSTGSQNTGNGTFALYQNTSGNYNTANGADALNSNRTGSGNNAFGSFALYRNTTGGYNTASSYYALYNNSTGIYNSAHGSFALFNNTTGQYNSASGVQALQTNTTGSNNTALGVFADVSTGNLTNATAIGYGAIVDSSNKVRIGNTIVTVIEGQVAFTNASDLRFKTNIKPMDKGLDFIMKLKPVSYQMKDSTDKRTNWGFIAQDIEKLVGTDNAVLTVGQDSLRSLGLRYTDFISPLVKSIQELSEKNTALTSENKELKQQLQTLKEKENAFSARLEKLENLVNKQ